MIRLSFEQKIQMRRIFWYIFFSQNIFRRFSESDDDTNNSTSFFTTPRGSVGGSSYGTISPRASIQHDAIPCSSKVGVVITSYRQSHRRWSLENISFFHIQNSSFNTICLLSHIKKRLVFFPWITKTWFFFILRRKNEFF